jgi:hypothetical protein
MFSLYYYAGIPIATNLLFYSITSLSTSISSSQNVVKFITEHKDCDSVVFKNELVDTDLENKLIIIESLIYDIIRKFSYNQEEFERTKKDILDPVTESVKIDIDTSFSVVDIKSNLKVLERIEEPLKLALISTADTVRTIESVLIEVRNKIEAHSRSYIKNFVSLSLKGELSKIHKFVKILDSRTHMLFELLKIYLPFVKKGTNKQPLNCK